jgi:hypothetical protein
MNAWLLAVAATLVAHAASALGALATTRFTRAALPLLLGLVLALDVVCGLLNVVHQGFRNGLVVLTAIPLAACMASLIDSRAAFAAVLLAAASVEVMTSFGGSLSARAVASAPEDAIRSLVILVPARGQPIAAVSMADLAVAGIAVACARRIAARRTRAFVAGALALLTVVTLDRVVGYHLAHLPLVAAALLLALLDRRDRPGEPLAESEA